MRVARLDLTRYGKFTDRSLDFGASTPGRPDLHVVYGPNEAGKSTALAGLLDLLFGIEARSRYNFIHPYATMRVGGRLDLAAGARELVRVKRQGASLLDAEGRAVDEGLIAAELGGIGRDGYGTMFSLDDETLEKGGEGILASRGDLGQMLFSASAGLAALGQTLKALHAEADGFHRARSHGTGLAKLKEALDALKGRRDEKDTQASAHGQLAAARDRFKAHYDEAAGARGAARARIDEIGRQLGALPRLADLRGLRDELRPLLDLPEAPAGWARDLPEVERRGIELATELRGLDAEIAAVSGDLESLVVDEAALVPTARAERLVEGRVRHRQAGEDLPERRAALAAATAEVDATLRRLGRPPDADPAAVPLGAAAEGRLRGLMESRSGIAAARERARDERAGAERDLADALLDLQRAGGAEAGSAEGDARGAAALQRALAASRGGDGAARLTLAERALPRLADALAERLRDLRPWPGTLAELIELVPPDPSAFEGLRAAEAEARAQLDRASAEVERLSAARDRLRAEIEALGEIAGVVGEREAAAARAARDRAWTAHRAALDGASAEVFEDSMRRDDIITGARFGRAGDVARLSRCHLDLAAVDVDLRAAGARREGAGREHRAAAGEVAAALARIVPPLPDGAAAVPLGPWLARRSAALAAGAALRQAERDRDEAAADDAAVRRAMAEALAEAGVPHDPAAALDRLAASAQAALDRETGLKQLRAQVEVQRRALAQRDRDLARATEAEAAWDAAWAEACGVCWLGEGGAVPSVDAVREVMKLLADLAAPLARRAELAGRIAAAEADRAAFSAEVGALAALIGCGAADASTAELDDEVDRRLREARDADAARAAGRRRLAAARDRRSEVAAADEAVRARAAAMTALYGVGTLAEVGASMRDAERRRGLREGIAAAERDIAAALRRPDAAAAEAALDGLDPSALEAELAELGPRLDDQDARMRDAHAGYVKAHDAVEAVGGDDAVARIEEERRTLLLDIEDQARRYLRLRAGVAAAEGALRAYRDRHRSAMMGRASDAFATISRGAYRGLATQPEKDAEILLAVSSDGSSKVASDLSKGTRFQLYLALRIAGYREFAETRRPVPFVADDIMETFDDVRAEEAFRLFAGMAEVGQVIYLTHHRHLVDIARSACPTVTVHELSAPESPP